MEFDGSVVPLGAEQRAELNEVVTQMANRGLRTLCLSYTDFPAEGNPPDFLEKSYDENLVAICIVGIKVRVVAFVGCTRTRMSKHVMS